MFGHRRGFPPTRGLRWTGACSMDQTLSWRAVGLAGYAYAAMRPPSLHESGAQTARRGAAPQPVYGRDKPWNVVWRERGTNLQPQLSTPCCVVLLWMTRSTGPQGARRSLDFPCGMRQAVKEGRVADHEHHEGRRWIWQPEISGSNWRVATATARSGIGASSYPRVATSQTAPS